MSIRSNIKMISRFKCAMISDENISRIRINARLNQYIEYKDYFRFSASTYKIVTEEVAEQVVCKNSLQYMIGHIDNRDYMLKRLEPVNLVCNYIFSNDELIKYGLLTDNAVIYQDFEEETILAHPELIKSPYIDKQHLSKKTIKEHGLRERKDNDFWIV